VVGDVLTTRPDIGGIYITGIGQRALTDILEERGLTGRMVVIGHELTDHARDALIRGRMDAVITQNVGHVMRSALRVLRAKIDGLPLDESQEQIRIEIVIRENLPGV
jgi:LacI family transcriptional regulator